VSEADEIVSEADEIVSEADEIVSEADEIVMLISPASHIPTREKGAGFEASVQK
jgi:hypothetical protein